MINAAAIHLFVFNININIIQIKKNAVFNVPNDKDPVAP